MMWLLLRYLLVRSRLTAGARLGILGLIGLVTFSALCSAAARPSPADAIEEILVTGERPGPGMWKVSKGGHDLWVLATLDPLPKKMSWRSRFVEKKISDSQLVLAPPEVMVDIGFFGDRAFRHSLARIRRDPLNQTLKDGLPPDIYARWQILRAQYLGHRTYERVRPIFAAVDLYDHALEKSGLNPDDHHVWRQVERYARSHHVPILEVTVPWQRDGAFSWMSEFDQISREDEIACLEKTIQRIDTDLEPMRHRANLWAVGDVEALREQSFPDDRQSCVRVLYSVPKWRDQLDRSDAKLSEDWLTAVDRSLDKYKSTLAVVPIAQWLSEDGWLARLKVKGYSIQDPK